jgi:HAD superfamily phosphoserine phosphatase-like hydrolase
MKVAIYDLDKTLVRRATFTPFLVFAARQLSPWRLAFLPAWIALMIGYRIGLYDRTRLKVMGMKLMLGKQPLEVLLKVGEAFAEAHISKAGWMEGVIAMVEADRREGRRVAIATAAFEFYATAFAQRLGIDDVIATRWDGGSIPGGNCYGPEKRRRVETWLGAAASEAEMRFVSDSFADKPLLSEADDAVFVTQSNKKKSRAQTRGWRVIDGSL